MLSVSTFGYTADISTIIHFIPHARQHITVDQSHSSGNTAASQRQITAALRTGFF
jgi:ribosomal protein S18